MLPEGAVSNGFRRSPAAQPEHHALGRSHPSARSLIDKLFRARISSEVLQTLVGDSAQAQLLTSTGLPETGLFFIARAKTSR